MNLSRGVFFLTAQAGHFGLTRQNDNQLTLKVTSERFWHLFFSKKNVFFWFYGLKLFFFWKNSLFLSLFPFLTAQICLFCFFKLVIPTKFLKSTEINSLFLRFFDAFSDFTSYIFEIIFLILQNSWNRRKLTHFFCIFCLLCL